MKAEILFLFMIYSMIGWLWETTYVSIRLKKYVNRGFLRGPVVPIYGFGATIIMEFMNAYVVILPDNLFLNIILSMIGMSIVATTLEYATSYTMELAFGTRWWDYSNNFMNLNGRISLVPSLFWGIGGYFLWFVVNTPLMALYQALSIQQLTLVLTVFYTLFFIDAFFTLKDLIQFSKLLHTLSETSRDLLDQLSKQKEKAEDSFFVMINDIISDVKESLPYKKLNAITSFNEFTQLLSSKSSFLSEKQRKAIDIVDDALLKLKKLNRFYEKYPNASTRKLPYLFSFLKRKNK